MSSNFRMTEESAVLISKIAEALRALAPGEAVGWDHFPYVPRQRRAYWVARAAKAAGIPCDWDRTGVLRCNPNDETTLRRPRKHRAGLVNKARRTQRSYEQAAAVLTPAAPAALHAEASYGAGIAGSVRGFLNQPNTQVTGAPKASLPIVKI